MEVHNIRNAGVLSVDFACRYSYLNKHRTVSGNSFESQKSLDAVAVREGELDEARAC